MSEMRNKIRELAARAPNTLPFISAYVDLNPQLEAGHRPGNGRTN